MEKLTDKELDSVFKNAAESNVPAFDATAWEAIAKKLDAPRPVPVWRKWIPLLVLGTSVFLMGVWVGRNTNNSDTLIPIESDALSKMSTAGVAQNPKDHQSKVEAMPKDNDPRIFQFN
jgi:hypothetical protein